MTTEPREQLYWHVHHDVLCEVLTGPIQGRIDNIRADKPAEEVETRLHLMRPVRGSSPLIEEWAAAYAAFAAAAYAANANAAAYAVTRAAYAATRAADAAYAAADAAADAALPDLLRLHAQECPDCPWDGQTIFPATVPLP